ncbi:hypothetical protein AURDEDRAFT_161059 [Auricularia subglabra TFB-10046 SS5]|nr:hypothetical protein AURDEDRAFT_161059 [Auricularia subglabra TFB-10046 SS5]
MPQSPNKILDETLLTTLFVMYMIPDALRVAASLVGVAGPTMVAFEALESTVETGEMWSIAVSSEEDAKKALESAQNDLKAADAITIACARESVQTKAARKVETAQGNLDAAVEEQAKMAKELGQSFIDWFKEDARREARNAELKKQNAEELAEAKRKRKEKKTGEPEASEGCKKVKEGEPVDRILRVRYALRLMQARRVRLLRQDGGKGGFACYDKTEAKAKGKACAACAASKQPCWIPATGALKSVLKGIAERLDSADGKLDGLEEKHEDFATELKAIKGVLKEQGECLASLVILQAENQRVLEAIAEKFEVAPSKSAGKRRERRKRAFKPMVVSEVVQREDEDEDEGPSKKRRRVEKAKPEVVASESEDKEAAETAKGKQKTPEGPVDGTLQSD